MRLSSVSTPGDTTARDRRILSLAAAFLLVLTGMLGASVRNGTRRIWLDEVASRIRHSELVEGVLGWADLPRLAAATSAMRTTKLTVALVAVVIEAVLVLVAWRRRDLWAIALCVGGPVLSLLITELVGKPLFGRRTGGEGLSFPSGHAAGAGSLAAVVVVLVHRWRGLRSAVRWVPAVALLPFCVGIAIVLVGMHYPTDVLGGLLLGAAVVLLMAATLPGAERLAGAGRR